MNAFKQHHRPIIDGHILLIILLSGWLMLSTLATAAPPPGDGYRLTVYYVIPSNRSEQPNARAQLQDYVLRMRDWYREEMSLQGYGNKSFIYETDPVDITGVKPKIHVVIANHPDSYFQDNIWGKTLTAIGEDRGGPYPAWWPWISDNPAGELVLVVTETHILHSNGILEGRYDGGTEGGEYYPFRGVGMVSGDYLARFSANDDIPFFPTDNTPYNGLTIPAIGPYPLVQDVTFPWYDGTTLSSISSAGQGVAIHELSHALGLDHEFRNDAHLNGNIMGLGLRGIRGPQYPALYPNDDTRLTSSQALLLNYNRFFNTTNTQKDFTGDNNPPSVNITIPAQNVAIPVNGQCPITFSASDESTLAGAILERDGEVAADMKFPLPLSTSVSTTLATYDYVPGQQHHWSVKVVDTQGNQASSTEVSLTCATGYNRAPKPYIKISKRLLNVNEAVVLDAGLSSDPDGRTSRMSVQWDLDGNGTYDTSYSRTKTFTTSYSNPGVYQITARLRDEQSKTSKSIPIGIRVE